MNIKFWGKIFEICLNKQDDKIIEFLWDKSAFSKVKYILPFFKYYLIRIIKTIQFFSRESKNFIVIHSSGINPNFTLDPPLMKFLYLQIV
jgi:hypothetical protein